MINKVSYNSSPGFKGALFLDKGLGISSTFAQKLYKVASDHRASIAINYNNAGLYVPDRSAFGVAAKTVKRILKGSGIKVARAPEMSKDEFKRIMDFEV